MLNGRHVTVTAMMMSNEDNNGGATGVNFWTTAKTRNQMELNTEPNSESDRLYKFNLVDEYQKITGTEGRCGIYAWHAVDARFGVGFESKGFEFGFRFELCAGVSVAVSVAVFRRVTQQMVMGMRGHRY
ncbi:hypothetical protein ACLKA6_002856 [Drosophila palustris]